MTRLRDLMCEDLFGCDHEPETPVSQDGEIVYWLCRCGQKKTYPKAEPPKEDTKP